MPLVKTSPTLNGNRHWKLRPAREATIEHTVVSDVNMPMTEVEARRLADRMFGDDKTESPVAGSGVHWRGGQADCRSRISCRKVANCRNNRQPPMVPAEPTGRSLIERRCSSACSRRRSQGYREEPGDRVLRPSECRQ